MTSKESTMKITAMFLAFACLVSLTAPSATAAQPDSPAAQRSIEKNVQAQHIDIHRKAVADANHLQLLATQLKDEMGRSTPDTLPADVIKRTMEIEKLARKVRSELQQ
jgi:hypothetical protein